MRRLKRKNIKRFKRFKPQAFQASSFKADSGFRQNDSYDQPVIMKQNFSPISNFLISAPPGRGEFPISIYHFHT